MPDCLDLKIQWIDWVWDWLTCLVYNWEVIHICETQFCSLVAIDLLTKKQRNQKNAIKIWTVLQEGCRHIFFIDFGSVLTSFFAIFWHIVRDFWQWNLKQISDIDFWKDFDGKWSKKTVIWRGRRQGRGLLSCQRQPKTQWFDTPSTLPKAGAAD